MAKKSLYLRKVEKIFSNIEPDKKQVVQPLIEQAGFMAEQLKKLSEHISEHGCVENYKNGENQFGKKKSSEVDVYNTMIKNFNTTIKQLVDLLPESNTEADELMEFLRK